jgi:hypothetical protein
MLLMLTPRAYFEIILATMIFILPVVWMLFGA